MLMPILYLLYVLKDINLCQHTLVKLKTEVVAEEGIDSFLFKQQSTPIVLAEWMIYAKSLNVA